MQENAGHTKIDRAGAVAGADALSSAPVRQTEGWPVKALEFIDSGAPALLNNPLRSMRVVSFPFLKHAMEVPYG
ncbi:MAG: hypothetical protein KGZ43_08955 [Sulfuritalea sp.]|nr:hypothetical protein [Sulfuritalea sp.]